MLRCLYCKSARWIWLQYVAVLPYSAGGVLQNDGQVKRNAMNTEPHLISNLAFFFNGPLKESCTQNANVCVFVQWFEVCCFACIFQSEPLLQLLKQQSSSAQRAFMYKVEHTPSCLFVFGHVRAKVGVIDSRDIDLVRRDIKRNRLNRFICNHQVEKQYAECEKRQVKEGNRDQEELTKKR